MDDNYFPRGVFLIVEDLDTGDLHISGDGCPICWRWKQFTFDELPNEKHHAACCMNRAA